MLFMHRKHFQLLKNEVHYSLNTFNEGLEQVIHAANPLYVNRYLKKPSNSTYDKKLKPQEWLKQINKTQKQGLILSKISLDKVLFTSQYFNSIEQINKGFTFSTYRLSNDSVSKKLLLQEFKSIEVHASSSNLYDYTYAFNLGEILNNRHEELIGKIEFDQTSKKVHFVMELLHKNESVLYKSLDLKTTDSTLSTQTLFLSLKTKDRIKENNALDEYQLKVYVYNPESSPIYIKSISLYKYLENEYEYGLLEAI